MIFPPVLAASVARQFGAEVVPLSFEWGSLTDADEIHRALRADLEIKAVLVSKSQG